MLSNILRVGRKKEKTLRILFIKL